MRYVPRKPRPPFHDSSFRRTAGTDRVERVREFRTALRLALAGDQESRERLRRQFGVRISSELV